MNNGGPAFPREDYQTDDAPGQRGMTMRDYFAAQALQGITGNSQASWAPSREQQESGITWADMAAKEAYELADAMLRRREQLPQNCSHPTEKS